MKIFDLLSDEKLINKNIVEKLICHYMDISKETLYKEYETSIDAETAEKILKGYHQFMDEKLPLEYIFGYVEFFGHQFNVTSDTIIPRPETEYMVKAVNDFLNTKNEKHILLDIGTGSGILGISTILFNESKIDHAYLTDISEPALDIARSNKEKLIPNYDNIKILKSNLVDGVSSELKDNSTPIILTGNLPYIPDQTFDQNVEINVKKWEPRVAFVGGDDGLDYYREMFAQMQNIGIIKDTTMFLEMMEWQVDILEKEFSDILNFEIVETFHFNIKILKAWGK